jgi:U3 small nucleolar RNA-associated protein 12
MKSYLRFEPKKTFGVISSPQCNVVYDFSGNLAISAALQDVTVWNLRQALQVRPTEIVSTILNYHFHLVI